MELIYNHDVQGVFGKYHTISEHLEDASADDLKKAAFAFRKDKDACLIISTSAYNYSLYWETYTDHQLEVVTVRAERGNEKTNFKVSYSQLRKAITKAIKGALMVA